MALLLLFAALAADPLVAYLDDLCQWILTLQPGAGELKNTKDTPWSLRWAETFYHQQRPAVTPGNREAGYWPFDGKDRDIYFGDTGTAATALAHALLKDEALNREMAPEIQPVIEWLLRHQNPDGTWGKLRSQDQQRSPGVVTLLAWHHRAVRRDDRVQAAIQRYTRYLLNPENSRAYGIKELVRTSGFVGLVFADLIRPGITL